ncbi:MAG: hypothetical protein WC551_07605 [Patescibacteria group bacterium]
MMAHNHATPSGLSVSSGGRFHTVDDLPNHAKEVVQQQLLARPELVAEGMRTVRAMRLASSLREVLAKQLHALVGGDKVKTAFAALESLVDHEDMLVVQKAEQEKRDVARAKFLEDQQKIEQGMQKAGGRR